MSHMWMPHSWIRRCTGIWSSCGKYMWHEGIHMCDMKGFICVTLSIDMCDTTDVTYSCVWHDIWDVTHSYGWHDRIHMCDMTYSYVWNDTCDVTHSYGIRMVYWKMARPSELHIPEPCHTHKRVISHIWTSQFGHPFEWVTWCTWRYRVA